MREIKFRAWNTDYKEMWDWKDVKRSTHFRLLEEASNIIFLQFTGLTDKNGKEIYEGDIVRLTIPDVSYVVQGNGWMDTEFEKGMTSEGTVKFLYSCWFIDVDEGKGCPLDFDEKQTLEVVGNIYENPDLLQS